MITSDEKKIKLYCFPFAGGSSVFYQPWRRLMPSFVDVQPYELPGRGIRLGEKLCTTVHEVVDDIIRNTGTAFSKESYAFFGHSMGSLIVLELTRRIESLGLPGPSVLFISGKGAPDFRVKHSNTQAMSEETLKGYLKSLGGVSDDFFNNPDLVQFFLPVIRNDLKLVEIYEPKPAKPFAADIVTLFGKSEHWTMEEMKGWQQYTTGGIQQFTFPGGHFFLKNFFPEISRIIAQTLHHQVIY
jgi:medium-chain acyl-[acyl-carrier-protein] hydrolase